jgi:hypothetical protein
MVSRFRRELTVIPPVQIAVSQRGIATTIDWRSERADRGLSGCPHSFGIVGDPSRAGLLPTDRFLIPGTRQDFGGGELARMTSTGLDGFKKLLLATREREHAIRSDITKARWQVALSWTTRALAWGTLVPAVSKYVRSRVNTAVAVRRAEVVNLKKNLAASRISVSFDMETAVAGPHLNMLDTFDKLSASTHSWALQTSQQIDRVRARSTAGTVVSRRVLSVGRRSDPLIDTNDLPLAVGVQNGRATAFFYPGFILVVSDGGADFALIDMKELEIAYSRTQFTETEAIPSDAAIVRKVWAKSNKNGTRDKRFKDNCELPVMVYGEISMMAQGGMNEALMFSRDDACREFVAAVVELQRILKSGPRPRVGTRAT